MNGLMRNPEMCERAAAVKPLTLAERLQTQKLHHEAQLERINAALAALEANPGAAELFEKISALNF